VADDELRDSITGRRRRVNPLNKKKPGLFELDEYMLGGEE